MKKLNKKGFTLIELLAVITIMGILMLVAIPAVSRTITNSRRSTFANTALQYVNAMKNVVAAEELAGCTGVTGGNLINAGTGYYYYNFTNVEGTTASDLLEQGGYSSWNNNSVTGRIVIYKGGTTDKPTYKYYVALYDTAGHGWKQYYYEKDVKRGIVALSGISGFEQRINEGGTATAVSPVQCSSLDG